MASLELIAGEIINTSSQPVVPPIVTAGIEFVKHCRNITQEYEASPNSEYPRPVGRQLTQQEQATYNASLRMLGQYFNLEQTFEKEVKDGKPDTPAFGDKTSD